MNKRIRRTKKRRGGRRSQQQRGGYIYDKTLRASVIKKTPKNIMKHSTTVKKTPSTL